MVLSLLLRTLPVNMYFEIIDQTNTNYIYTVVLQLTDV